ncbi:MAG: hypothetical protein AB7V26_08660 [Lysobacterales bacterium]
MLRSEWRVLVEQGLWPLLAALLPWRWALATVRRRSRGGAALLAHGRRSAAAAAAVYTEAANPGFAERAQFVALLDQLDAFRSVLRGFGPLKHWQVEGAWPAAPCVAVSLHYGNGFWALGHLRQHGHRAHFVAQGVDPGWLRSRPVTRLIMRFRRWCHERLTEAAVIYTGGAKGRAAAALAAGESIVALIDVPHGLSRGCVPMRLFGQALAVQTGMIRLARELGVPVVPFLTRIGDGQNRRLLIGPSLREGTAEQVARTVAEWLAEAAAADPAAWQLWPQLPEFIQAAADQP